MRCLHADEGISRVVEARRVVTIIKSEGVLKTRLINYEIRSRFLKHTSHMRAARIQKSLYLRVFNRRGIICAFRGFCRNRERNLALSWNSSQA